MEVNALVGAKLQYRDHAQARVGFGDGSADVERLQRLQRETADVERLQRETADPLPIGPGE